VHEKTKQVIAEDTTSKNLGSDVSLLQKSLYVRNDIIGHRV